jgi:hypothetical protein
MPITRTPIIDDSGSGQDGTVLDNAWKQQFYDQIDGALPIDLTSGFIDLTTVWKTDAGVVLSPTVELNRYKRITPFSGGSLIYWEGGVSAISLATATGFITCESLPFSSLSTQQYFPFTRSHMGGGFFSYGGAGSQRFMRMDQQAWPVGTGYLFWAVVMAVEL